MCLPYRDPLFAEEKRRHPALTLVLIIVVILIMGIAFGNYMNNARVDVLKSAVTVTGLPAALNNFRILHISDLHGLQFGPGHDRLQAAIATLNYDIVCITGDVLAPNGDETAFLELIDLFKGKAGDIPVYFIAGDEDPEPIAPSAEGTALAPWILHAQEHGAVYLDAPIRIDKGKGTIWLSPEWVYTVEADATQTALQNRLKELQSETGAEIATLSVAYQLERLERIRSARRDTSEDDVQIAVTHCPLMQSALSDLYLYCKSNTENYVNRISLILAGHYCGGQWRLPLIGPIKVPESSALGSGGWLPESERVSGVYYYMGIAQYITPGLGASNACGLPAFRLFNTPCVSLITLTGKLTN